MVAEATDSLHDALEVLSGEIRRAKMLDHIVEDEECKLEALLLGASEAGRDDLVAEALDKRTTEVLVSLEEGTHELGGSDLEIELI